MLAFFPWLRLQEQPTVGPYELVPHSRGEQPAGEGTSEQATPDSILEPYVSSRAEPIGLATLLRCDGGELTAELTEEQRQRMFDFSEVVAFAGLAAMSHRRLLEFLVERLTRDPRDRAEEPPPNFNNLRDIPVAGSGQIRKRPHRPGTSTPDRVERDEHSINRRAP